MKVALVNPPTVASVTTFAEEAVPPLGLAYVAAAVTAAGYVLTVVDAVGEALSSYRIHSRENRSLVRGLTAPAICARIPPDTRVIGVSCMFSNAWVPTRGLLFALRAAFPRAVFVVGGEHATACAELVLATSPVDACVLGEGEITFVELLRAVEEGAPLAGLPGVAARSAAPVPLRPIRRKRAPLPTIAEPAWDLFPIERYIAGGHNHGVVRGRTMPILASRGCPYQCTFCSSPAMWTTKWAARAPEDVVAEMRRYVDRYRANDFAFYDLTTIIRRDWIVAFCRLLVLSGLEVTWQLPSGTRSEAIDAEVAELLHRSGCRNLNYAPESGSPAVLRRIKKRVALPRMLGSMRDAVGAGLAVKTNIILGFPGETLAEVGETYRFIAQVAALGVEAVSIFPFCPYPGSELFEQLRREGRVELSDAYFDGLVYTDLASLSSYDEHLGTTALKALVLGGNAVFFAVQLGTHPRRVLELVRQLVGGEGSAKLASVVLPVRRRRAAFRELLAELS